MMGVFAKSRLDGRGRSARDPAHRLPRQSLTAEQLGGEGRPGSHRLQVKVSVPSRRAKARAGAGVRVSLRIHL